MVYMCPVRVENLSDAFIGLDVLLILKYSAFSSSCVKKGCVSMYKEYFECLVEIVNILGGPSSLITKFSSYFKN